VAAILSIVETCRRVKIPIRDYLAAVLPGIADVSIATRPPHPLGVGCPAAVAGRRSYSATNCSTSFRFRQRRTPLLHSLPYFITKSVLGTDGFL
jgi:hypothetical protein